MKKIKVLDLFAGPGGLGEGFAGLSLRGQHNPFEIIFSAEKELSAVNTLRLRTFLRLCREKTGRAPHTYLEYVSHESDLPYDTETRALWKKANREITPIVLGTTEGDSRLDEVLAQLKLTDDWVLIGGPPCQAYSLAGRSRNRGISHYRPEEDERHFLYRVYLDILTRYRPAIFVMENVKGILSSRVNNRLIFPHILKDLSLPGGNRSSVRYRIHSLTSDAVFHPGDDPDKLDPREFIIRSEEYGIPQARHRVILVGIRDEGNATPALPTLPQITERICVREAIGDLPRVRSGLSRGDTDSQAWKGAVERAVLDSLRGTVPEDVAFQMKESLTALMASDFVHGRGAEFIPMEKPCSSSLPAGYHQHVRGSPLASGVLNHYARGHMPADLARYMFASAYASVRGVSPVTREFPDSLAPAHRSWRSGHFADRFRVQLQDEPSSTITSHLSKDGHYFIHHDSSQCRSFTVREAARLQTFPDDYFFEGSRTEQYVQVGNAVPPLLARQIAKAVLDCLGRA